MASRSTENFILLLQKSMTLVTKIKITKDNVKTKRLLNKKASVGPFYYFSNHFI